MNKESIDKLTQALLRQLHETLMDNTGMRVSKHMFAGVPGNDTEITAYVISSCNKELVDLYEAITTQYYATKEANNNGRSESIDS